MRTRIREVGLSRTGMTGSGLVALISGARGQLTHVDSSGNELDDEAAGTLGELDEARTLASLNLSACQITERVLARLAAAHRLSSLSRLDLSSNRLSSDDGREVVRMLERFPSLATVDLSDNALGNPFVRALASSSLPARCQRIELAHNALTDADLDTLVESTWPALRHLGLNGNAVSQAGGATLSSSPAMPLLATLDQRGNLLKAASTSTASRARPSRGSSRASRSSPRASTVSSSLVIPDCSRSSPASPCGIGSSTCSPP